MPLISLFFTKYAISIFWVCIFSEQAGHIIESIQLAGFQITALEQINLEKVNAEEFLEVYRGVVQEYSLMVHEMTSGACIAMEIKATERAQERFRETCGPMDPVSNMCARFVPSILSIEFKIKTLTLDSLPIIGV